MAAPQDLISLSDAKVALAITSTTYDAELPAYITSASDVIATRVGPIAGAPQYDETYDGGGPRIALRHVPVASIVSITEAWGSSIYKTLTLQVLDDGTAKDAFGYTLESYNGILTRRAMGVVVPFAAGVRNVHVVYTGGYATVPAELATACKLLVKHFWENRRGGSRRPGLGGDSPAIVGDGDMFPPEVEEILANFYNPGIA